VLNSELEHHRASLWQSSNAAMEQFKRRIDERAEVSGSGVAGTE